MNGTSRYKGFIFIGLVAGSMVARGEVNPYQSIWLRNSFGLKAPAPAALPPALPPAPKPVVKLTGLTSFLAGKRAMLLVQHPDGRNEYLTLAEREQNGGVEILAIDEDEGTVRINLGGEELALNFANDGLASPGTSSSAVVVGAAMRTGMAATMPVDRMRPGTVMVPVTETAVAQRPTMAPVESAPSGRELSLRPLRAETENQVVHHVAPGETPLTIEQAEALIRVNAVIQPPDYPPLPVLE